MGRLEWAWGNKQKGNEKRRQTNVENKSANRGKKK
jgi:hypothetical protein